MYRPHVRLDGRPKLRLTELTARAMAVEMTARHRVPRDAYRCGICDAWHVGRRMPWWQRSATWTLRVELGERAWFNLKFENIRGPDARRAAIGQRTRRFRSAA